MDDRPTMSEEDKAYYDAMLDLTATEEWNTFIDETVNPALQVMLETAVDLDDERALYHRKGQVERLRWLSRFRDVIEAEMKAHEAF